MTQDKSIVKISVRSLVEYVLRCGDLSFGFTGASRALEGARAHRRYQKAQPDDYQPEVSLSWQRETPELTLLVNGRADGVVSNDAGVMIDEIKTTTAPLESIRPEDHPLYWAQAKCYAYMYLTEKKLPAVSVRLTYYQLDSREIRQFVLPFSAAELESFFTSLVERYLEWARRIRDWQLERDASIQQLEFPFPAYRAGQRELAVTVYRAVAGGRKLFAQAPTGIGKTMAALFPAIKSMPGGLTEKVFYLTAKTVTKELAETAFDRLRQCGLACKAVTITAKDKICPTPGSSCSPDECARARGHYDRVNAAIGELWETQALNRGNIEACAARHSVCPYELSLDLAFWADAVICDYNYVFDPRVYLRRFFGDGGQEGDYCFLIDEAHNLVDRAREMFSAELTRQPFQDLKRSLGKQVPPLAKALQAAGKFLATLGKACDAGDGELRQTAAPAEFLPLLHRFTAQAETWLAQAESAPFRDELLELYFAANAFLRVADTYDERFITYAHRLGKNVRLRLFCLDPSHLLQEALQRGRAAVFFSATLTPLEYFVEVLGGEAADGRIRVNSPFPRENLGLFVADHIPLTYRVRDASYDEVAASIAALTAGRTGNYLVFAPSYQYLDELYRRFTGRYPAARCLCQSHGMSEAERSDFLAAFSGVPSAESLTGFAVLGGMFGEGIDLTGDRLSGVVIIGVGLPQLGGERDMIRDYHTRRNNQGFEYAYLYPGMNKVLQAAGRVIRTEQDRGVVLLIDQRFRRPDYHSLFPPEWSGGRLVRSPAQISAAVEKFWRQR